MSRTPPIRSQSVTQFQRWGFTAEEAQAWIDAGYAVGLAHRWKQVGIASPSDIPDGISYPEAWNFVVSGSLPRTAQWAALWGHTNASVARMGHACGQSPQAVRAFSRAVLSLRPSTGHGGRASWEWPSPEAMDVLNAAALVAHLDWADAAACISVGGLSVQDAVEHLDSGADVSAWRLVAALSEG